MKLPYQCQTQAQSRLQQRLYLFSYHPNSILHLIFNLFSFTLRYNK